VICRPCLRAYEIPFHGVSGVKQEYQIPVADLMVRVEEGRVVLRSVRLDKEVIPRLTAAHNAPQAELGVYRFLCALQTQGVCYWLAWDWGILESADYLPRIQAGKLVLSRARWRLEAGDLEQIVTSRGADLMLALRELRQRFTLPRWVQAIQADRLLPLDLENIICAELLSTLARDKPALDLTELYPLPEVACVSGPEGCFNHELVVPLQQPAAREANAPRTSKIKYRAASLYSPGSEWLTVKIYTGVTQGERILSELLVNFVAAERNKGSFERWFFLRYADPHPHLRLRFNGGSEQLAPLWQRLSKALEPYVDNESVWRLQLDSYEPEIERYGGLIGINHSEAIFDADSDAGIQLLQLVTEGARRWYLVLLSVHRLFEDLGIDLDARLRQLSAMRGSLISEFELGESANRALGRKHREFRKETEHILDASSSGDAYAELAGQILDQRSRRVAPVAAELHRAQAAGDLEISVEELAPSYVHMTSNRLLRAAARAQELVLYELLIRHYRSLLAQQN
jgi:thiopeptide-type bacteriocin biosynthesis protein